MKKIDDIEVTIGNICYQLGENIFDIKDDGPAKIDDNQRESLTKNGIKYYATSDKSPSELAADAVLKTLEECDIAAEDIDAVVYSTCSFWSDPELPELGKNSQLSSEFSKKIIKNVVFDLGMENAQTYGVFLAESGNFTSGMRFANNLLYSDDVENIIYVNTDKLTEDESKIVPSEISIMSEAAVSCLVSSTQKGEFRIENIAQKSKPSMSAFEKGDFLRVLMEVAKGVELTCKAALKGNKPEDYLKLITNNYSENTLRMLSYQAGFTNEQLFMDNLSRFAHAFASDNLINLKDYCDLNEVKSGDKFMLLSTGPVTWGAVDVIKQ